MSERRFPLTRDMPAMPGQPSLQTVLALLEQTVEAQERHIEATDARVAALEKERDKALIWGIGALGTALMGVGAWVVNYVSAHLKP